MQAWRSEGIRFPWFRLAVAAGSCALALGCTAKSVGTKSVQPSPAVSASRAALGGVETIGGRTTPAGPGGVETVERSSGLTRIAKTYRSAKEWIAPAPTPEGSTGVASWYGPYFHGRVTANGEVFDRTALSAAHLTLPLPSYVRVTNLKNDRSVVVRVNDRGPYVGDRLIDVSERTAELLQFKRSGMAPVRVEYIGPAPAKAADQEFLVASYRGPDAGSNGGRGLMLASFESSGSARVASAQPGLAPARVSNREDHPTKRATLVHTAAFAPDEPTIASSVPSAESDGNPAAPHAADRRILVAFQTVGEFDP